MKTLRISLVAVLSLLFLPYAVLLLVAEVQHAHLLYPSPQNTSAFLKTYAPAPVVEPFAANETHSSLVSSGGAGGKSYTTHDNSFSFQLPLTPAGQRLLQTALYNDILAELQNNRAQIIALTGDSETGARIDYRAGNSTGCVRLLPVARDFGVRRGYSLPPGVVDISATVKISEWWSPGPASPSPQEKARLCSARL